MLKSVYHDIKVVNAISPQTINNAHVDGAGINRAGYDRVAFLVNCGSIAAGSLCSFKVQQCDTDTDGSYTDITNASVTYADTDDDKATVIDVRPTKLWVRLVATNGAAFAALMSGIAELYNGRVTPVTQGFAGAFVA